MDRKGTNELISGEKSFIAILSNLRVYFVVRLPDYITCAYPVPEKKFTYRHREVHSGAILSCAYEEVFFRLWRWCDDHC